MPINNPRPPRGSSMKQWLWDWDAVNLASDDECCYSLTGKEVQILLAQIEPIGWLRRWVSPGDNVIDPETLEDWAAGLASKLMSGCCPDQEVLHRVTDDGQMQISTDGGETWTQDPNDPRLTGTQLPNTIPGTGSDKKCNAATNAVENFKDAQSSFAASLSTATTIIGLALEMAGEIILLLLSAGTTAEVLVPLIISGAVALFGVLETDYNALFTNDVWDALTCDLFCTIGSDGQFTTTQYNNLLARLDTHGWDTLIVQTFQTILRGWGTRGLNNACISGTAATADCSDCDCGNCGDDMQPYSTPDFGTFVSNAAGVVTYIVGTTGYLIVGNFTPGTCCFVNDITVSGTSAVCCFIPCPNSYSDTLYVFATPVGQCVQWLQVQGTPGDTITVTYSPCP